MATNIGQRVWKNFGTLLLSFALAFAVWISAVVSADPNEECRQINSVTINLDGLGSEMLIIGDVPETITVRLQAPSSICREMASQPGLVRAQVDLNGVAAGENTLPIVVNISAQPVRLLEFLPKFISVEIEEHAQIELSIKMVLNGEPARGFQTEDPVLDIEKAAVSGPLSLIQQVEEIWAVLDINGKQASISELVLLTGVDGNGQIVSGITIEPQRVLVTQPIIQSGGFRTVAVRVETVGQPGAGYRLTTIQVSPPTVTISSADPQMIEDLPGFVSTQQLDLSELTENEEVRLSLELPPGVFVEGEQTVLVFIGITAIESTVVLTVPVEIIGLALGLEAQISPETVDVFLSGPVAILNALTEEDVRVFVDLSEHDEVGRFVVELIVEILPDRLQLDSTNPITVEITLIIQLTPIATPTENATPSP